MTERVQIPFDAKDASEKEKEEGQPKTLNRPAISDSLRKPKMGFHKQYLYRHCNCGSLACCSPYIPNDTWHWVYRDKITNKIVDDPSLPRFGPDGDGWTRREGYNDAEYTGGPQDFDRID